MKEMYYYTCTCGNVGRKVTDPNYASETAENHERKHDPNQGGRSDGREHRTTVLPV